MWPVSVVSDPGLRSTAGAQLQLSFHISFLTDTGHDHHKIGLINDETILDGSSVQILLFIS